MNRDDVLKKIRKLLALGDSDNEHESAAAIARAQALMTKHEISETMLDVQDQEPEEEIRDFHDPVAKAGARWRGWLCSVIAQANGAGVYRSGKVYKIYGRPSNVETARYLIGYCVNEVERLAGRYKGEGRTWLNNYRLGCVEAIAKAIREEKRKVEESMRAEAAGTSALVPLENALVKIEEQRNEVKVFGKKKLKLRKASGSASNYDSNARALGRAEGRSIYPTGSRRGVGAGNKRVAG